MNYLLLEHLNGKKFSKHDMTPNHVIAAQHQSTPPILPFPACQPNLVLHFEFCTTSSYMYIVGVGVGMVWYGMV